MSRPVHEANYVSPAKLKLLKTGDVFDIRCTTDTAQTAQTVQRFTVIGADIIHHNSPKLAQGSAATPPATITLATTYPFGRPIKGTPLRYVVYAKLTP